MICRIEDLKKISQILLMAVDTSDTSRLTENLELKVSDGVLTLSVTNGEYLVKARISIFENIDFHATVNAELFLKLVSKITTETVEFTLKENSLVIIGNGEYRIPLIYEDDHLLALPEIQVENVTNSFNIKGATLKSILQYNSKELSKCSTISNLVQRLYYIDSKGAITFTSGACVNSFELEDEVKFLLNQKVVTLFKLFGDKDVAFQLGHSMTAAGELETRVKFDSDLFTIVYIVPGDEKLINSVPVKSIRQRAFEEYPYSINVNRKELLNAFERLMLFFDSSSIRAYGYMEFAGNKLKIYDYSRHNYEDVNIINNGRDIELYTAYIDISDITTTLSSLDSEHVTIHFGNNQAFVLSKPNVHAVLPEVVL